MTRDKNGRFEKGSTPFFKGKEMPKNVRDKISETKILRKQTPNKKYFFTSEQAKSLWKTNPPKRHSNITSYKKGHKEINKEIEEKRIRNALKALFETRPTSLEKRFIEIIKKYTLPYKYTGDGSFLIGYKNPDFINVNGQKICIEVANKVPAHHPEDYEQKKTEHFAKYGWKCLVFFADRKKFDDSEEEILKKLNGVISQ